MKRRLLIAFWTVAIVLASRRVRIGGLVAGLAALAWIVADPSSARDAIFLGMPVAIPIIFAVAGTAIASSASVILAVGVVGAALIGAAVTLAGTLIAQALFSPGRSTQQQSGQRMTETHNPHPAVRFRFGEFRTAGQVVFRAVGPLNWINSPGGLTRNRWLYQTILLNAAPSESVSRFWINENVQLSIRSDANNDILDMQKGAGTETQPYVPNIRLWLGLGDQTQFPQQFIDEVGDQYPEIATASWNGCTVLHVWASFGDAASAPSKWWLGEPKFEVIGKFAKLYDPRKDPTSGAAGASGSHDRDDPLTWEWSPNPALAALFLLRDQKVLSRRDEQILIDMFAEAADDCDEIIGTQAASPVYTWGPIPSSGAVPSFDGATAVGTVAGMSATAATSPQEYATIRFPGQLAVVPGDRYKLDLLTDGVSVTVTLQSRVYSGDEDRSLWWVLPTGTAFAAQSVTVTEIGSATVGPRTWGAVYGDIDHVDPTGYLAIHPTTTATMRLKTVHPALNKAAIYFDMYQEGIDVGSGAGAGASIDVTPKYIGTVSTWGQLQIFEADSSGGVGDPLASQFGMPVDAVNISTHFDSGLNLMGAGVGATHTVTQTKRYLSVVLTGGPPSGSPTLTMEVYGLSLALAGSVAVRYRCDGVVEINARDYGLLDGVLESCAGHLDTSGGRIGMRAGVWKAPVATLTNPVGDGFETTDRRDAGFDEMVASFISRLREYTATETQPYVIGTAQRRQELDLSMVREPGQAARLAIIQAERFRKNRTVVGTFAADEWTRRVGQRVTTSFPWWPDADGTWMIQREQPIATEAEDGFTIRKEIALVEDDATTYAIPAGLPGEFVFTGPIGGAPIGYSEPPPTGLAALSDVTTARAAVAGETSSGGLVPRIRIRISPALGEPTHYEVQINDGSGYVQWRNLDPTVLTGSPAVVEAFIEPVTMGASYDIRVRSVGSGVSGWIELTGILVQPFGATLAAPTLVSEAYDNSMEIRTLVFRAPNDPDVAQMVVHVSDTEFGARSLLYSEFLGGNQTMTVVDDPVFHGSVRWYHVWATDVWGTAGPGLTVTFTANGSFSRAYSSAYSRGYA